MNKILKAKLKYDPKKSCWNINLSDIKKYNNKFVEVYYTGETFKEVRALRILDDDADWNWPEYMFIFKPEQLEFDFNAKT